MKRRLRVRLTASVGPDRSAEQLPGIRTWRILAKVLKALGLHPDSRPFWGVRGMERSNRTGQVAAV